MVTKDRVMAISEAGLESSEEKVQSLVNNLVNSKTAGFRRSDVIIRAFPLELQSAQEKLLGVSKQALYPRVEGTFYDNIRGSLVRTEQPTDLALGTDGYFVLSCSWGEGYTRDGRFYVDKDGRMLSVSGNNPLMGRSGPINVTPLSKIEITQNGEVKVDDTVVDQIRVVNFDSPSNLHSVNGVVFSDPTNSLQQAEVNYPRIIQGYIEASNVNVVDETMDLIYLQRLYSLNTKMIQTRDGNMTRALDIGRVQ